METQIKNPEKWILKEALSVMKRDSHAGKAWLLTAKSLYPRNIEIQLEIFNQEKNTKNAKRTATTLQEMLHTFPLEPSLWDEVMIMASALQADVPDDKARFYKEVFECLPVQSQCAMLLQVVDMQRNLLARCKLMVLVLKRYPNTIPEHGMKLIESLISSEENTQTDSPVNCYRKFLVCDILPQVLRSSSGARFSEAQVLRWLQKATEFYVCYISQSIGSLDHETPTKARRLSSVERRASIQGLAEKEAHINNPWQNLVDIFNMAALHMRWTTAELFKIPGREPQWQHVYGILQKMQTAEGSSGHSHLAQLFYSALLLGFDCILNYSAKMDSQTLGPSTQPLVLIEGFRSSSQDSTEHKAKKMRTEGSQLQVHAHSSINGSAELIENLKVAVKCWELLHSSEQLLSELTSLLRDWRADQWSWLHAFQVDFALYQGNLKEVVKLLAENTETTKAPQIKNDLQLACSYYTIGNYPKCCETVLGLIELVKGDVPSSGPVMPSGSGRHLHIMPCQMTHILPYCIHLLVTCLGEKAFKNFPAGDVALGHMLVLLQYDWPKYESMFAEAVDVIRRRGSFKYNLFFNYIINIDIIEHFAWLRSNEGGKVNLDILPISSSLITQSRTVTRGVNKGVKEDFKTSLEKQVSRCNEDVETNIRQFLIEEKKYLQQSLL